MACLKCDYRRPKTSNTSDPSAEPQHDNESYEKSDVSFVKVKTEASDRASVGQNRKIRDTGSRNWSFVEDSADYACSSSWNEDSGFVDFPIAGGKSDLSQNAQRRERWKLQMVERSKSTIRSSPKADKSSSVDFLRRLDFPESPDDEEIAEWFGHEKIETKRHVPQPD